MCSIWDRLYSRFVASAENSSGIAKKKSWEKERKKKEKKWKNEKSNFWMRLLVGVEDLVNLKTFRDIGYFSVGNKNR
jgi:hypothetical protein